MQIFVKYQETITMNVDEKDTIEQLKSQIEQKEGIPTNH